MRSLIIIWLFALLSIAGFGYIVSYADSTPGQCAGYPNGQCEFNPAISQCLKDNTCSKDQTPPDPNRPYFDACGNEYDYLGNLIAKGTGCQVSQPAQPATVPGFKGK